MIAALALAASALVGLHGYGSFPPWMVPGVVRVPSADGTAYVEIRLQAGGVVGSRAGESAAVPGELPALDSFRVVRLASAGFVAATPRWMRPQERRALEEGDVLVGVGDLERAPLAAIVLEGGRGLAVCDLRGVTVHDVVGGDAQTLRHAETFGSEPSGRFGPSVVWPLDWAQSPPRSCALFEDGDGRLLIALRFDDAGWRTARFDPESSTRLDDPADEDDALPALESLAPDLSAGIALEIHAQRSADRSGLAEAARRVRDDARFPWESRLVAARVAADDASPADRAAAVRIVVDLMEEGVGGHTSFDDWLAMALLPAILRGEPAAGDLEAKLARVLSVALVDRELAEAGPALALLGEPAVAPVLKARLRLTALAAGSRSTPDDGLNQVDSVPLLAAADSAYAALLLDPRTQDVAAEALATALERGEGTDMFESLLRLGARALEDALDVRPVLARRLGLLWPRGVELPGPMTRSVLEGQIARLGELDAAGESAAARRLDGELRRTVRDAPAGRSSADWSAWWSASGSAAPTVGELERAAGAPASGRWGQPDAALAGLLAELDELPADRSWPLLAEGLREGQDRIDELGLRFELARRLEVARGQVLSPEARAARREVLDWL